MSFGQELKDFVSGYKTGTDIAEKRETQRLNRERFGKPTDADLPAGGGIGSSTPPAIPEAQGGGSKSASSGKGVRGDELAWKGATPEQRGLLNAIAGPESGGRYNVIYRGGSLDDFRDHPRKAVQIRTGPNAKRTSSAAGKYQFLGSTWDHIAQKYGLKDFSPENQDKAAWYLAAETYGGEDKLMAALKSGDPKVIAGVGSALRSQWTSLPGGIEQGQNTNQFVQNFTKYRDSSPKTATAAAEPATTAPAAKPAAEPAAAKTATEEAKPEEQAMLSPEAGVAIPENEFIMQPTQTAAVIPPEEGWMQGTQFAQRGGVLPEPVQRFQTGGRPGEPGSIPANPAGQPDKYSRFRNYTQQIPQSTTPSWTPRRVSSPAAAPAMQMTDGLTPSQLAFKQANNKIAADR